MLGRSQEERRRLRRRLHDLSFAVTSHRVHLPTCYIAPAVPAPDFPAGEQRLHEIKFDDRHLQPEKHGGSATHRTKNGYYYSSRLRWLANAPARSRGISSFVFDGELVFADGAYQTLYFCLRARDLGGGSPCLLDVRWMYR
jgi:hypothetical protein